MRVTLWRRPVTSTGAVSTVARSSIVVRGPFTWTVGGSTTTRPSWTSGGGEPRSCGTTRSARVAAVATATRTQFGETRTTLMPAGACTSSAESCSVLSPSRARERSTRTRTSAGASRAAAQRAASTCTSTASRCVPTRTIPGSRPTYSRGAAKPNWLRLALTTKNQTTTARMRASSLSSQLRASAASISARTRTAAPPGARGSAGRAASHARTPARPRSWRPAA